MHTQAHLPLPRRAYLSVSKLDIVVTPFFLLRAAATLTHPLNACTHKHMYPFGRRLTLVFENSIMWPMWAMKTRQQVQTGAVTQSLSIRRMGGVRSLYKGFLFYAVASLPAYLVYISTYTYAKSALGLHYNISPSDGHPTGTVPGPSIQQTMAPMFAGFIADAACLALYIPVEIVAQRLQLPTRYSGVQQVLTDMWREDGA